MAKSYVNQEHHMAKRCAEASRIREKYPDRIPINCAIIPRVGSNINEAEVTRFCKQNLDAFKVLKNGFITDSVPKTATGKIQRRIVPEHFLSHISAAKVPD